jgi:hypothetical protein
MLEVFFMIKAKEYSDAPRVYDQAKWIIDQEKKERKDSLKK